MQDLEQRQEAQRKERQHKAQEEQKKASKRCCLCQSRLLLQQSSGHKHSSAVPFETLEESVEDLLQAAETSRLLNTKGQRAVQCSEPLREILCGGSQTCLT